MRELQPQALRQLTKTRFERFCRRLLEHEYVERFDPGVVDIEGGDEDEPDGQRDLLAIVSESAHRKVHFALLPDERADVWYSCKSHRDDGKQRDPGGWRKQIRDDLDPMPRLVDGRTGELVDDAAKRADEKRPPPAKLLETLAGGGRFVVLVNVEAAKRIEFQGELRTLLRFWLERKFGEAPDLRKAVQVHDAGYLAQAYNLRPFVLSSDLQAQLDIKEPGHLLDWDRWTSEFERDRRNMRYRDDDTRATITQQLLELIRADARAAVFRIWGPPGVGKTRLVHHALASAGLEERVRFSQDIFSVRDWLRERKVANNQILVVDEVPPVEAGALARAFREIAPERARLLIVGPQELGHEGGPPPVLVEPLATASTRAILVDEMGADDDRVDRVCGLCGGHPLFAMWLGHALSRDSELLRAPGSALTNDDDPWDATCAVLVGPRGADHDAWRSNGERRGKALVLACLLGERPWEGLTEAEQGRLANVLGLQWAELTRAAGVCESRSLLRRVAFIDGVHRYVSPANIERLVLNHFFGGPGSPPLDPRRIAATIPEFFSALLRRAQHVQASDSCKRNLTKALLDEVHARILGDDAGSATELVECLPVASRVSVSAALTAMVQLVKEFGARQVAESGWGPWVKDGLEHVAHRKISKRSFARVESTLFELARYRREKVCRIFDLGMRFADAQLTPSSERHYSVWARLFAPILHLTNRPFDERFELLRRRLTSFNADERALATVALGAIVDPFLESRQVTEGWDDTDGPWEHQQTLGPDDYGRRFATVWSALLEACEDTDDTVSSIARDAVVQHVRVGLAAALAKEHVEQLTKSVQTWRADQRDRLAQQLDGVDRYAAATLRERPELANSLATLRLNLEPVSLLEKVIAQVGRWHPGPWPINAEVRFEREQTGDAELARLFLATPGAVADHLDWLCSDEAVRARLFAMALGGQDTPMRLLPELLAAGPDSAGRAFVAAYIAGWADTVGDRQFDQWRKTADAQVGAEILARALVLIPGADVRVGPLIELLANPVVPAGVLAGVGFSSRWSEAVSTPMLDALVVALDGRPEAGIARESVGLIRILLERLSNDPSGQTRAAIHRLLARTDRGSLPAIVGLAWAKSVVALAKRGDFEPVAAALRQVAAPSYVGFPHHLVDALQELVAAGLAVPTRAVVEELLDGEAAARNLASVLEDAGLSADDYARYG